MHVLKGFIVALALCFFSGVGYSSEEQSSLKLPFNPGESFTGNESDEKFLGTYLSFKDMLHLRSYHYQKKIVVVLKKKKKASESSSVYVDDHLIFAIRSRINLDEYDIQLPNDNLEMSVKQKIESLLSDFKFIDNTEVKASSGDLTKSFENVIHDFFQIFATPILTARTETGYSLYLEEISWHPKIDPSLNKLVALYDNINDIGLSEYFESIIKDSFSKLNESHKIPPKKFEYNLNNVLSCFSSAFAKFAGARTSYSSFVGRGFDIKNNVLPPKSEYVLLHGTTSHAFYSMIMSGLRSQVKCEDDGWPMASGERGTSPGGDGYYDLAFWSKKDQSKGLHLLPGYGKRYRLEFPISIGISKTGVSNFLDFYINLFQENVTYLEKMKNSNNGQRLTRLEKDLLGDLKKKIEELDKDMKSCSSESVNMSKLTIFRHGTARFLNNEEVKTKAIYAFPIQLQFVDSVFAPPYTHDFIERILIDHGLNHIKILSFNVSEHLKP